tara:strand:+ start:1079 stop:1309 length:231 start_codon:yes stop_codon:yes gene_type:complete
MTRLFWKINYQNSTYGEWGEDYQVSDIYWGTWMEAARWCIKQDNGEPKRHGRDFNREVSVFELPNVKRRRKGFFVC